MAGRCWSLGLLVAFLLAACSIDASEDEPAFEYGRDEMKSAIEGTWEGTTTTKEGAAGAAATLTLLYGAPETRPLCGNRVLANGEAQLVGPRCTSLSSMNVTGTWTSQPPASAAPRDAPVRGTFTVWSLRFTGHGDLQADLGDEKLLATLSDGVLEGRLEGADGAVISGLTLRRK